MPARRAVATGAPGGVGEFVDDDEVCPLDALNHKLGNPVTTGYFRGDHPIVVDEVDQDFATVSGIDRTGRVEHGHAEPVGQPRARVHQPDVAVRQGDGDAGRY